VTGRPYPYSRYRADADVNQSINQFMNYIFFGSSQKANISNGNMSIICKQPSAKYELVRLLKFAAARHTHTPVNDLVLSRLHCGIGGHTHSPVLHSNRTSRDRDASSLTCWRLDSNKRTICATCSLAARPEFNTLSCPIDRPPTNPIY